MFNSYESEVAKVECINAAASCLRALSRGIPYLLVLAAMVYTMQAALDGPYALTCKTTAAEKPIRSVKHRPQVLSSEMEEPSAKVPEAPLLKAKPVRED
jgi:hypothetical protein